MSERGWCPACPNGPFVVLADGLLMVHGPRDDRCPGSWEPPAAQPAPRRLPPPPRTLQVLALAATGLMNAEIARRMHLSEDTVKTHMQRAFRQLGARDRAHAVHIACHRGLLGCRTEDEGRAAL